MHSYFAQFYREIETCSCALVSLGRASNELLKIRAKCSPGLLIPTGKHDAIELFNMSELIDQRPFYGRCMGLHVSLQFAHFISIFPLISFNFPFSSTASQLDGSCN